MNEKGECEKHGEFNLVEGCPQCLAEKQGAERLKTAEAINLEAGVGKAEPEQPAPEAAAETAIALRPGEDIEARSYYKDGLRLLEYADVRVIASVEDVKAATDDLAIISKLKKVMENKRRSLLDPLKLQAEAIRETYSSLMDPVFRADKITREKILAFTQEQERIRREQEAINRQKAELAAREAALNGREVEPVELVEVTPEAPKRVSTDMGTVGQRDNWKWEVVDFALVPDSYKMINSGVLTPVVKASKGKIEIPGVRIFNEPIIAVNAR